MHELDQAGGLQAANGLNAFRVKIRLENDRLDSGSQFLLQKLKYSWRSDGAASQKVPPKGDSATNQLILFRWFPGLRQSQARAFHFGAPVGTNFIFWNFWNAWTGRP